MRVFLTQLANGVPVEWTEAPSAEWAGVVKALSRAVTRKTRPLTWARAASVLLSHLGDMEGVGRTERFNKAQSLLGASRQAHSGMTAEASDSRLASELCMRGQPHQGRVIRGQNSC